MDELTKEQMAELEAQLLQLRQEMGDLQTSSSEGGKTVELDQASVGRLSRMDALQQQQMAHASQRSAGQRLAQIDAAFKRLADGDYGFCALCEEPIGYARLKARPEAPFCLDCQSRKEG